MVYKEALGRPSLAGYSSQVEPGQSLTELVPLYISQVADGTLSVNMFLDAAMSTPVPSKSFQEVGCKHGDM